MKETLTISIDVELEKRLSDAAWRARLNRSAFMSKILREGVERIEKEKADQAVPAA